MPELDDLTGKRFGMLTVLERVEDHVFPGGTPVPQWKCVCDCGNITIKTSTKLKTVKTPNCGCQYNLDLTGQVFGQLLVMSQAPSHFTPQGKPIKRWLCKCSCGNEKIVMGQSLKKGMTKSCGCLTDLDLTGKRVGYLLVLEKVKSTKRHTRQWLCQCDCGNQTIKTTADLNSEHVKSCGRCRENEGRVWDGYRWLYKPNYPHNSKGWVQEHIYVYETETGNSLAEGEMIHHINMDKTDNSINNLYLCSNVSEHGKAHASINSLVQELISDGIIGFEDGEYFLAEDVL